MFDSPARRTALRLCAWDAGFDAVALENAMRRCEAAADWDRAAALAVFDCRLNLAVGALQRGVAHARVPDGPRYRIDYVWSRAPTEAGAGLVARAACVERDCGGASDHQPIVIEWGG